MTTSSRASSGELTGHDVASALQWYMDIGWEEAVLAVAQDRLAHDPSVSIQAPLVAPHAVAAQNPPSVEPLGTAEARGAVGSLLSGVSSLDELKQALGKFTGMAISKTATNMVFGDGNPAARLMVIGEVPDAEDDKIGRAFAGEAGQLLDKMMAAIGLSRQSAEAAKAVYLTQVLNWRPPGNRTPSAAEIDLSTPFLEKHIDLVKPDVLLFMGSVPVRALLGRTESMTKLRGNWFEYKSIPCLVSYPPSFLLKSPAKKRESWEDLQALQQKLV
ncbi:MAG: uracil-DNA glycosylase [Alphaproteobacteria bacterium]|nr:uracil-DNA glycosylase [Alphaproteobacteria bacterium]